MRRRRAAAPGRRPPPAAAEAPPERPLSSFARGCRREAGRAKRQGGVTPGASPLTCWDPGADDTSSPCSGVQGVWVRGDAGGGAARSLWGGGGGSGRTRGGRGTQNSRSQLRSKHRVRRPKSTATRLARLSHRQLAPQTRLYLYHLCVSAPWAGSCARVGRCVGGPGGPRAARDAVSSRSVGRLARSPACAAATPPPPPSTLYVWIPRD
jgi:hypothetical protein